MYHEPEWTEESKNREYGSTDFKQCGWCRHASGVHRYTCCIKGSCKLMKGYDDEVKWDDECKLKKLGKEDVVSIIESKKSSIKSYQSSIKRLEEQIELLSNMDFEDIPPLPDNRRYNHFNLDDEVMVYIGNDEQCIIKNKWLKGKVILGYRHHDGCVSVRTDEKYYNGDFEDGHGYGAGYAIPTVMLRSEYEYFAKNPDKFKVWFKQAYDKSFYDERINLDSIAIPTL